MKNRGFLLLIGFAVLILAVGLACSALSSTDGSTTSTSTGTSTGSDLITFTDKNNYYQIDVPGNWKYSQTVDKTNNYYYLDQYKSPDENALVENIAYDDGTAFVSSQNGKFALYLLNTFYSNTGKEGDIKVIEDKIQNDGSDRLTWSSTGGGYSGVSYFEVRNKTTFLMFTVQWLDQYQSNYMDTLDKIISSYRQPK